MKNRIRELREARGWKQRDLAEAVGIDISHIHRLETGKRNLNTNLMQRIGQALNVPPATLISDDAPSDGGFSPADKALLMDIFDALADAYHKTGQTKPFRAILEESLAELEAITAVTPNQKEHHEDIRKMIDVACKRIEKKSENTD